MLNRLAPMAGISSPERPRAASRPRPLQFGQDSVQLSNRRKQLFQKYQLNPDTLSVVSTGSALAAPKQEVLYRLLEAHEQANTALAVRKQLQGEFSNSSYACNVQLRNGLWALASNVEHSRDKTLCSEIVALSTARDKAIGQIDPERFQSDAQYREQAVSGMSYRMIVLTNHKLVDPDIVSCGDCLGWMANNPHIRPDTQLVTLRRDPQTEQPYLHLQTVADLLPFPPRPSLSSSPLSELPLQRTEQATARLKQTHLKPKAMRALLQQAKDAYEGNQTAPLSGKNTGSATLFSNGEVVTGQRLDITARWHRNGTMTAFAQGIQDDPEARLQAVALYGQENVPTPEVLARLAQTQWGSPDTLIITAEEDAIQVRTIRDYLKEIFLADSSIRKHG